MEADVKALQRDISMFRQAVDKFAGLLAGKNVTVTFRGSECHTDGKNIVLPSLDALQGLPPEQLKKAQEFVDSMIGYVNHEVGHVLFSDFEAWRGYNLHKPQMRAVANVVEDHFVERRLKLMWPGTGRHLDKYAHTIVENAGKDYKSKDMFTQLSQALSYKLRGDKFDYAQEHFHPEVAKWVNTKARKYLEAAKNVQNTRESLTVARALYEAMREALEQPKPPPPPESDEGKPLPQAGKGDEEGSQGGKGKTPGKPEEDESEGEGDLPEDAEEGPGEGTEPEEEAEDGAPGEDDGDREEDSEDPDNQEQEDGGDGTAEDDQELEEAGYEEANAGSLNEYNDNSASIENSQADVATDAHEQVQDRFTQLLKHNDRSEKRPYAIYTTEHDSIGLMRRDRRSDWEIWRAWCSRFGLRGPSHIGRRVGEPDIDRVMKYITDLSEGTVGPLRSSLSRVLKARGQAYTIRDLERGKLDRRRLWKIPMAQHIGVQPRVRKEDVQAEVYNLALIIAINESGSMMIYANEDLKMAELPASYDYRPTRMDMAAAAGLALGDVLHALKIPFAILGHSTCGGKADLRIAERRIATVKNIQDRNVFTRWGDLTIEYVKDFQSTWTSRRHFMGGLYGQINTYDAEVVNHCTQRLLQQRDVTRRILIMLDDGQPCPDGGMFQDLHCRELVTSVEKAKHQGVEVVGVGMGCDVSPFYPNNVTVNNIAELPAVLLRTFGKLLGVKK